MRSYRSGAAVLLLSMLASTVGVSPPAQGSVDGPVLGDEWRKYDLLPKSRSVPAASVVEVEENGGVVTSPEGALAPGGQVLGLTKTDADSDPRIILDFGREVGGYLEADFADTSARTLFAFSESLGYMGDLGDTFGSTSFIANEDQSLPQRERRFESPHEHEAAEAGTWRDPVIRGGFRYVMIRLAPEAPAGSSVSLDALRVDYTPMPGYDLSEPAAIYQGRFLSSDHDLNRMWYGGVNTLAVGTIDPTQGIENGTETIGVGERVIIDGAKRDRLIWNGDLAITGRIAYASTFDLQAMRDSLRSIAMTQRDDGYLSGCSPNGLGAAACQNYLEYHLWWLIALEEYYLYSGDADFVEELWPVFVDAMGYLDSRVDGDLLHLGSQGGHWIYADSGKETEVNALYVQVLRDGAALAELREEPGLAREWRDRAGSIADAVNATLWDAEKGAYRQSTGQPGNVPQDGNVFAVLNGIAAPERADSALDYLRDELSTPYGTKSGSGSMPQLVGPFMNYFDVLARFQEGRGTEAWDLIDKVWGYMFAEAKPINGVMEPPATSAWEHINLDGSPYRRKDGSLAHPWSAGATALLSNQVLGVRPTSPGFATWSLVPHPGDVDWAKGRVPTPQGPVDVSWRYDRSSFSLDFQAPEGTSGQVGVPTFGRDVRVTVDGEVAWDGRKKRAYDAHTDGRYVYLEGVAGGAHEIVVRFTGRPSRTMDATVSPGSAVLAGGESTTFVVTVTGQSPYPLRGSVKAKLPEGWTAKPSVARFRLEGDGRERSTEVPITVTAPPDASGIQQLQFDVTATGRLDDMVSASVGVLERVKAWEFETPGDTEGWVPTNQLTPLVVADGALATSSTGGDPNMTQSRPLSIDAPDGLTLEVEMSSSVSAEGKFYFTTKGSPGLSESKSVGFPVTAGETRTYRVALGGQSTPVTGLRYDPITAVGDVRIDAIRVLRPPAG